MPHKKIQLRSLVALTALTIMALAVTAGSAAATVRINGQSSTVTLNSTVMSKMATKQVTVNASSPTFKVTAGLINPATGYGNYKVRGSFTFSKGSKRVTVSLLNIVRGGNSYVTGSIGSTAYTVFGASRGTVSRNGFDTDVSGMELSISPAVATALNTGLGLKKKKDRVFKSGAFAAQSITSVTKQIESIPNKSEIRIAVDTGALSRLAEVGVSVSAVKPAKSSATELGFPITKGLLATGSYKGNLTASGGLAFKKGNKKLIVTAPVLKIAGAYTLKVRHGKKNIVFGTLDTSAMTRDVNIETRHIVYRGARVLLSPAMARTLNTAFSTKSFLRNDSIGQLAADVYAR